MKKILSGFLAGTLLLSSALPAFATGADLEFKNVGNTSVAEFSAKEIVSEDFSSYELTENIMDENGASTNSNFTIGKAKTNNGDDLEYTNDSKIAIANKDGNNVLKLTSSTKSTFPVVSYISGKGEEHAEGRQLVVKANLFFDKETALNYKVGNDADAKPWPAFDRVNMGFVSVFDTYATSCKRERAITTIAFNYKADWNDNTYIPAYITAPNTSINSGKAYSDSSNCGAHLAEVNLPTDKWFEVKFVYDLPSATDNTSENATIPIKVYVDGNKVLNKTVILPKLGANESTTWSGAFAQKYHGIAFAPNAYRSEDNKGESSPSMYVDDISVRYETASFINEDFSAGYELNTNFISETVDTSKNKKLTIRQPMSNEWNDFRTYGYSGNSVSVEEINGEKALKLKSSNSSTFPNVVYNPEIGTQNKADSQLVVKTKMYFDKETATGYKVNVDEKTVNDKYPCYDNVNLGFMSVLPNTQKQTTRNDAITTIACDIYNANAWPSNGEYIPAFVYVPNIKGGGANDEAHSSAANRTYTKAGYNRINLPTDEWFEIKCIYDLTNVTLGDIVGDNHYKHLPVKVYLKDALVFDDYAIVQEPSYGWGGVILEEYCGIAFSPTAYITDTNKGSVSPVMYVDDIVVDYVTPGNYLKYDIANTADTAKTFTVIAAYYNEDGSLKSVEFVEDYTVAANSTKTEYINLVTKDYNSVKLFAWDNINDMTPLATSADYSDPVVDVEPVE